MIFVPKWKLILFWVVVPPSRSRTELQIPLNQPFRILWVHFGLSLCLQHNARRHLDSYEGNLLPKTLRLRGKLAPVGDEQTPCRSYVARYTRSTSFILIGSQFSKSDHTQRKDNSEPRSIPDRPLSPSWRCRFSTSVETSGCIREGDERFVLNRVLGRGNQYPL